MATLYIPPMVRTTIYIVGYEQYRDNVFFHHYHSNFLVESDAMSLYEDWAALIPQLTVTNVAIRKEILKSRSTPSAYQKGIFASRIMEQAGRMKDWDSFEYLKMAGRDYARNTSRF